MALSGQSELRDSIHTDPGILRLHAGFFESRALIYLAGQWYSLTQVWQ